MNRRLAAAVTAFTVAGSAGAVAGCAASEPRAGPGAAAPLRTESRPAADPRPGPRAAAERRAESGATADRHAERDVLPEIVTSIVQLRAELEGSERRAGSGVVVASDPAFSRCWIVTTRHLLEPTRPRRLSARLPGRDGSFDAEIVKVSGEVDLAILLVQGVAPPAARLKDFTGLGREVWVVGFPWGKRLTVVRGVVSQLGGDDDDARLQGPARLVDASVSYGTSGAGVFEIGTGLLVGIVEGYRTARIALPNAPESVLHVPVPGETTVISSAGISRFLSSAGVSR